MNSATQSGVQNCPFVRSFSRLILERGSMYVFVSAMSFYFNESIPIFMDLAKEFETDNTKVLDKTV